MKDIKHILLERKRDLEEELNEMRQERFLDDPIQDQGDQALSATMENLKTSFQDSKLQEYHRVVQALEMLSEGTYGICMDCENKIPEKRLTMFPNATRCLACQELFEESRF